jgi:phosphate transport system substrate-binding protein
MILLVQQWATEFMVKYPGIALYTDGGGTGDGISALIDGSADIAAGSRPMNSDEIRRLAERYQSIGVSLLTAKDALSIFVHPDNPVSQLSSDQIKKIFTGEITSWLEVGGNDMPVTVYNREPNSGTYVFLKEHLLLGSEFTPDHRTMPGSQALVRAVAQDSAGIGYSTSAYIRDVKTLAVDGIAPSLDNVQNGSYPLSRYFYLYTPFSPAGNIKTFIDWVISEEGQRTAQQSGYIPLYDLP